MYNKKVRYCSQFSLSKESLRLYDVSVRKNSIFLSEGRKFSTSILWRKKLRISIFSFSSPRTQFFSNLDFLLISPKNAYIYCVWKLKCFCDFYASSERKSFGDAVYLIDWWLHYSTLLQALLTLCMYIVACSMYSWTQKSESIYLDL